MVPIYAFPAVVERQKCYITTAWGLTVIHEVMCAVFMQFCELWRKENPRVTTSSTQSQICFSYFETWS